MWDWDSFQWFQHQLKVIKFSSIWQCHLAITVELRELQQKSNLGEDHSAYDVTYDEGNFFSCCMGEVVQMLEEANHNAHGPSLGTSMEHLVASLIDD